MGRVFNDLGDGETIDQLWVAQARVRTAKTLDKISAMKTDQKIQNNWEKIDGSSFYKNY